MNEQPVNAKVSAADDLTRAENVQLTEEDLSRISGGIEGESEDEKFKNQ